MEDKRNIDRSEEELRHIIREEIRRSRANGVKICASEPRLRFVRHLQL